MKKGKEKELQGLEFFCIITALAVCILGILFLFNVLQNHWFLNFILGLGILLHAALGLLFLVRHKQLPALVSGVLTLLYAGCMVYFNLL